MYVCHLCFYVLIKLLRQSLMLKNENVINKKIKNIYNAMKFHQNARIYNLQDSGILPLNIRRSTLSTIEGGRI